MKKKKENEKESTEEIDCGHFQFKLSKIKPHRTKKDSIEVEGYLNLHNFNTIKFKIEALSENWKAFNKYFYDFVYIHPDLFVDDFFERLIKPVIQKIKFKPESGKFRGKEPFYNAFRNASVWLYLFVSYWCKKDIETWSPLLREAVKKLEKEGYELKKTTVYRKRILYDSKIITYHLIKKYFQRDIERVKLSWDDEVSFYNTYIAKNPLYKENKERFEKSEMHSHLEAIPFLIKILQK